MSDFLSTLAGRTLGTIPVVSPRRRSRYEPDTLFEASPPDELNPENVTRSVETHLASNPTAARAAAALSHAARSPEVPRAPAKPVSTTKLPPPRPLPPPSPLLLPHNTAHTTSTPVTPKVPAAPNSTSRESAAGLLTPRTIHRDSSSSLPPSPAPAPAIHVSIGRVEVRAIQRPDKTPALPPATTAPVRSSLRAYLRGSRATRE